MKKKKGARIVIAVLSGCGIALVIMKALSKFIREDKNRSKCACKNNPMEGKKVIFIENIDEPENADGVRGHLEAVGFSEYSQGFYDRYVKRFIDMVLSFLGIIFLLPVFAGIALAIFIDDPGPVFFAQKRIGQNKKYFMLYKFRSMKMCTPRDVPTHMLENPEQYITSVGKFIRAHSLDELPQLINVFVGDMSLVGPRPGLWNQDILTAERDKFRANDVKPGITGWAQINGRDSIEITKKAELDGEYVKKESFLFDLKCLIGTFAKVFHDDAVVEGGPEKTEKIYCNYTDGKSDIELIGHIGFGEAVEVDKEGRKKVLITGANSYIGEYFKKYALQKYKRNYEIEELDMLNERWRERDFSAYDIIYHIAGIAHADVGNVSEKTKQNYYLVNTELAIEVAKKAKKEGVGEFVLMSSMIVYGDSARYGIKRIIDENTVPIPENYYGDSKLQADVAVRMLADEKFRVIVLRPPMIYGKGSKGNYPMLAKLARKIPIFPDVENERSMIYIENFCEFLCQIMLIKDIKENAVVLMPQNAEWSNTTEMVKQIAWANNRKIVTLKLFRPFLAFCGRIPGKLGRLVNKAFGNNRYSYEVSKYEGVNYQIYDLQSTIQRTELNNRGQLDDEENHQTKKNVLVVSQYFYPEQFRINDMCRDWVERGYNVTVLTGIPNYPGGSFYDGYGYKKIRKENLNGVKIIRIPIIPRGNNSVSLIANYASFVIAGLCKVLLWKVEVDFVFTFEVSPMTQALVGCWYAKKHRVPHYLYVQDLWPENVISVTGMSNQMIIKSIDKMVDYIYKSSDEIFATSPSFVDAIINRRVSVPKEKVHYWPQYAEEYYKPVEKGYAKNEAVKYGIPNDSSFKIIFTGNIGKAQGLDILPKVATLLKKENVKFVIVGEGRLLDDLNHGIKKSEVESMFIMIPRQPAEDIPILLSSCEVAFLSFADDDLWKMTIPAKLQSYMACGMPVLAIASGESKRIIDESRCGICIEKRDCYELKNAILAMMQLCLTEIGMRGRKYYDSNFERGKLLDYIDKVFTEGI